MLRLGDRVLAMWPAEVEWWYPGVVCLVVGAEAEIQYDDGDEEWTTVSMVRIHRDDLSAMY